MSSSPPRRSDGDGSDVEGSFGRDPLDVRLSAWVDAAGLPPGDHEVEVKLQPPPGIEVEQVSPNRVRLRITRS